MVHPLLEPIVKINYSLGNEQFVATGFYLDYDGDTFLVTNRHVFEHELGVSPEEIRITVRRAEDSENIEPLYVQTHDENQNPLWLTHPTYEKADLAVLPTDFEFEETGNSKYPEGVMVSLEDDITIGEENPRVDLLGGDAIVAGYPLAFEDSRSHSPIVRSGLISSSYGPFFNGEPCFIIDAIMHRGMSGSPVFTSPGTAYWSREQEGTLMWTPSGEEDLEFPVALLGVHSGPINDPDRYHGSQMKVADLQLNQVWYSDLILDIIDAR